MAKFSCRVAAVALVILAAGCKGGPTTGTPLSANGGPFEVTGVVSDEDGAPVPGAAVTMTHCLESFLRRPSVLTDALGQDGP